MTLAGALVVTAMVLLVIGPLMATVLFTPRRAANVRIAEIQTQAMAEHIAALRTVHPEIVRTTRVDRHHSYIWIHVGLFLYGLGVTLAPAPNSNLSTLSWATQQALGLCLLVGSTIALTGITLGARITKHRRIAPGVARNLVSGILGDDIRLPYTLACFGLLSIAVAMGYYVAGIIIASHGRLYGTLGGGLSAAIGTMCVTLGAVLLQRIRSYSKARSLLIAEAVALLGGS